jgi:hypothetical protein
MAEDNNIETLDRFGETDLEALQSELAPLQSDPETGETLLESHEDAEGETLLDSTLERANLALEQKERQRQLETQNKEASEVQRILSETTQSIESLDPNLTLDEQREAYENFQPYLETVLLKALVHKSPEELTSSPLLIKDYLPEDRPVYQTFFKKFKQLIMEEGAGADEFKKNWHVEVQDAQENKEELEGEKEKMENGETPENTKWMGTGMRIGLMAMGAVGSIWLYKKLKKRLEAKKEGEEVEKEPFWKKALAGVATMLGVGALIGPERLEEWGSKHLNLSITGDGIKNFLDHINPFSENFSLKKAWESLKFDTKSPSILAASKFLKIDKSFLIDVKDQSLEELKKSRSSGGRMALSTTQKFFDYLGVDADTPFIGIDDELKDAKSEEALLKFIDANKDKIGSKINKMSIGQILKEMHEQKLFQSEPSENPEEDDGSNGSETPDEKTSENPDESDEDSEEGPQARLGSLERDGSSISHMKTALERFRSREIDLPTAAAEMIDACAKDKASIVNLDGRLWTLTKTGALIFISASSIVVGLFHDVYQAKAEDKSLGQSGKDIAINYWKRGGGWWMGAGAAQGIAYNYLYKGQPFLASLAKGAFRGGTAPLQLIPMSANATRGAFRFNTSLKASTIDAARQLESVTALKNIDMKIIAQQSRALYHGEKYKYYYSILEEAEATGAKGFARRQILKLKGKDWIRKMMEMHGKKFIESGKVFQVLLTKNGTTSPHFTLLDEIDLKTFTSKETSVEQNLFKAANELLEHHPESEMLRIHFNAPKHATTAKARNSARQSNARRVRAGQAAETFTELKIRPDQIQKLKDLKLSPQFAERLRELKVTELELDEVIKAIEANPKLKPKLEWALSKSRNRELMKKVRHAGYFLTTMVFLWEIEHSEDKASTIAKFGSNGVGGGVLGYGATLVPIPNQILKGLFVGAVSIGGALGGDALWNNYGQPQLEKHFPNREEYFSHPNALPIYDYLANLSGSTAWNAGKYALDQADIIGGLDEETDPLSYLQEKSRFIHPKTYLHNIKSIFTDDEMLRAFQDHDMHTLSEMTERATEAKKEAIDELSRMNKTENEEDYLELEAAILHYKNIETGAWLEKKEGEQMIQEFLIIEPSLSYFRTLSISNFGENAGDVFDKIMEKISRGEKHIEEGDEMHIWQFLTNETYKTEQGGEIRFLDILLLKLSIQKDKEFIQQLRTSNPNDFEQASQVS